MQGSNHFLQESEFINYCFLAGIELRDEIRIQTYGGQSSLFKNFKKLEY